MPVMTQRLCHRVSLALLFLCLGGVLSSPALPADETAAARQPGSEATVEQPLRPSTPEDVEAFLEAWAVKMRGIQSIAIRFRQEKKLRILRRPKVSEGDLVYADGMLSVVVRGKDGQVESQLLMKDGELRIFYPQLKRLEVIPLGGVSAKGAPLPPSGAGPSIPFFAGDPREATRDYVVRLERGREVDLLSLEPRDTSVPVKRLELKLVGFVLKEYRQVETSGDELRMEILASETNPGVRPERFRLAVPEGTIEVRPAGK